MAKFTHINAPALLDPRWLDLKRTWVKRADKMSEFNKNQTSNPTTLSSSEQQLTHRCVQSDVLLVRVEVLVLLPAELTDVAPSF